MTAQQQAAALGVLSGVLDELYGPDPRAPGRPLLVGPDAHGVHDPSQNNSAVLDYLADFATATATLPLYAVTHHEYIEIDYLSVLNASFLDASALLGAQVVAAVRAASNHSAPLVDLLPYTDEARLAANATGDEGNGTVTRGYGGVGSATDVYDSLALTAWPDSDWSGAGSSLSFAFRGWDDVETGVERVEFTLLEIGRAHV